MRRCLGLAQKGIGTTRPNPSVGAVIVADNTIIGEGFTSPFGGNHAEVNAIASVKDLTFLKRATMYVTLEPCSHHGKTPPCSDLILEKGILRVVIGCIDTNSLVAGRGIKKLKKGGCEVIVGILEEECKEHHRRFFTFHNKKRPYIILKWAATSDRFIAPTYRKERAPVWITNIRSRQLVHQWRAEEHGILVGTNTVLKDNPKLNVRLWKGQNPIRIIIDKTLKIHKEAYVYDCSVKTIFICDILTKEHSEAVSSEKNSPKCIFERVDFSKPLGIQVCRVLHKHQIQSLIVEGGTRTLQTFINEDLWDEARVFTSDVLFGDGVRAPELLEKAVEDRDIGSDNLKTYKNDQEYSL
ncbi:MAG: bifunctional diaminohydroxyphosphoribosylaminopyrimidine deaminase/5-amino-6-(5-phosphoribosylamino)uracil reductase RibD [Flavobacteriaceae bacterium]|nr:bifunctional diaminohydroxyphosphoribosylaminopyrimidine deaminase/5-amino-6-(5-phosphoribosylamino)uracil reductase RibD [Flavobacteriaceae bacterium]